MIWSCERTLQYRESLFKFYTFSTTTDRAARKRFDPFRSGRIPAAFRFSLLVAKEEYAIYMINSYLSYEYNVQEQNEATR